MPARGRIELATGGFFLILIVGALAGIPPLRERAVETLRAAIDRVVPAQWAAYYLEIDDLAALQNGDPTGAEARLMFASGSLPGRASRLLSPQVFTGTWSPNGERFLATSGTRLFVGDRDGGVKQLTDLVDLHPTAAPLWGGDDEVLVAVSRTGREQWLMRLDAHTGQILDQRDLAFELTPYAPSPDGKWLLAIDDRTELGVLYELATGRRVAAPQGSSFVAWYGDGRIVVSRIDGEGAHIGAQAPGGDAFETLVDLDGAPLLPGISRGGRVAFVEAQNVDPNGPRAIWVLTPGQTPVRVAKDLGRVYFPTPSRDGRYVGFSEYDPVPGGPINVRAGVIDMASKKVVYACSAGCAVLDVR